MTELRRGLPPLPARIKALPVDERGYPIPYFVAEIDGKRDFRIADATKRARCVRRGLCWVCGEPLGRHKTYIAGPMCGINRTTSEPPCHYDCAVFSVTACPFLTLPKALRREANMPEGTNDGAGLGLKRNPGVSMLWTTERGPLAFRVPVDAVAQVGAGAGWLLQLPEPERVEWYCEGRTATREEVRASIDSGLPSLRSVAEQQDAETNGRSRSTSYLDSCVAQFIRQYLPAPPAPSEGGSDVERTTDLPGARPGEIRTDVVERSDRG